MKIKTLKLRESKKKESKKNKKFGSVAILLALFLLIFFTFIMLTLIKHSYMYYKVKSDSELEAIYCNPTLNKIKTDISLIKKITKGEVNIDYISDENLLKALYIKIPDTEQTVNLNFNSISLNNNYIDKPSSHRVKYDLSQQELKIFLYESDGTIKEININSVSNTNDWNNLQQEMGNLKINIDNKFNEIKSKSIEDISNILKPLLKDYVIWLFKEGITLRDNVYNVEIIKDNLEFINGDQIKYSADLDIVLSVKQGNRKLVRYPSNIGMVYKLEPFTSFSCNFNKRVNNYYIDNIKIWGFVGLKLIDIGIGL